MKCEPFDPIANENVMRKNLFHFCSELDRCIGSKLPRDLVGSSPPVLADPKSRRWFFDPDRSYDDSEPPAKKVKTDEKSGETEPVIEPQLEETEIPNSERCIICLEKRRTHAFLHYGLSDKVLTQIVKIINNQIRRDHQAGIQVPLPRNVYKLTWKKIFWLI